MSPFAFAMNGKVIPSWEKVFFFNFAMNMAQFYAVLCPSIATRFYCFAQRPMMVCFTLHRGVRCKNVTSSGVRVATGHQIPCEWTYITLGCFLRTLTMTDRPRKDTDLSLFVGPYQPRSSSCNPSPPFPFSFRAPDPFMAPNKSGCRIWTALALNLVNEMV